MIYLHYYYIGNSTETRYGHFSQTAAFDLACTPGIIRKGKEESIYMYFLCVEECMYMN